GPAKKRIGRKAQGPTITSRAFWVVLVLVVLALSYANTLRIYVSQQHELAVAEQQIRERSAKIADLEEELNRWNDPEYVKIQARDRLGWVMPGETGFRVVDENGDPVGGGVAVESSQNPDGEYGPAWWSRMLGSIQVADAPQRKVANR
ncbi:MAG: septum formation initiator family protein, partial [Propionibacteriaceae bacterium]|nr:septum formation initiator family protein [Propionibacteriaceae bacterium]